MRERTAYEQVLLARDQKRPNIKDYVNVLFEDFLELKGDRLGKEDPSIFGGIGLFEGMPVTVIGHCKGKNLEESLACNFGMPEPQGYRKAMRLMKQAEKFHRPVITFIDTPGAFPGLEAEANGQSNAIAENLMEMMHLKTPVLAIVTGEGNSGGALAIGVANRVWMLENAVYSILSPEGFASILWKDASRKQEACECMKMTAQELYDVSLVDGVIPEPDGGIQEDPQEGMKQIRRVLRGELANLLEFSGEELARMRYAKYRHFEGARGPVMGNTESENMLIDIKRHRERKEVS